MDSFKSSKPSPWQAAEKDTFEKTLDELPRNTNLKKVVLGVLVLILVGGGIGGYYYFTALGRPDVSLEIVDPGPVLLGQPATLNISFSNLSENVLKNVSVSVILPDGVSFVGQSQDQRVMQQQVGDVGPGSIGQQAFNVIVTAGAQAVKQIQTRLQYTTVAQGKTNFENTADMSLRVGDPAIALNLDVPKSIFNGENFNIKVTYQNNTTQSFKNLQLKFDYPPIFQFKKSDPDPQSGSNNTWTIGGLNPGEMGTITISGNVIGPEQSQFALNGTMSGGFLGQMYVLNTQNSNIGISLAPLSLVLTANDNDSTAIIHPADMLQYRLKYKNNSDTNLQNITITAKLKGEMYDFNNLRTNGSFDSLLNTVTWLAANTPELASLAPGAENYVEIDIPVKKDYPIRRVNDKNYTLKVEGRIQSPTVPTNTAADQTVSLATIENKIIGALSVNAEALWRDAASGILNKGPFPPKVNQPTQYTIHWILKNYSTDVSGVTVFAYLQSGTRFTGNVKSTTANQPVYDPSSGLVTWRIDSLPATKGVVSDPAEAIFQVENTPAVNQAGEFVTLLGGTQIKGQDGFVNQEISASSPELSTNLQDPSMLLIDKRVQP